MKNFEFLYHTREKENFNAETIEEACKMFADKHAGEDIELDYEVETDDGKMVDISNVTSIKDLLG